MIFFWYLLPSVKYSFVSTTIALAVIFLSVLILYNYTFTWEIYSKLLLITFIYSLLVWVVPGGMHFKIGFLPVLENSFYILPVLLSYSIINRHDKRESQFFIIILSVVLFIVYNATQIALIENPGVARTLAQGDFSDELMELRFGNVGGFGFAYCIAPIGLLLLQLSFKLRSWKRLIALFLLIYISIFIFLTQYTTLLVFYTIGIGLLIFCNIENKFLRFIIILSLFFTIFYISDILSGLSNFTHEGGYDSLEGHFEDFYGMTQGEDMRSSRGDRASDALKIWLKSPIWGNYDANVPGTMIYPIILGAHSGVATILASTGIIGLFLYFTFLFYCWKPLHVSLKNQNCNPLVLDISFLFLIAVSFINPISSSYELPLIIFLFVPLTIYYLKPRKHITKA